MVDDDQSTGDLKTDFNFGVRTSAIFTKQFENKVKLSFGQKQEGP